MSDAESIQLAETERVRGLLRRHLSPRVADAVLHEDHAIESAGQFCDATVLFADLRGFTRYAERNDPLQVARFLNEFLTQMTEVIFKYDGVLDKYIGDEVMAEFGVPIAQPDHAERAVHVALEMQARHAQLLEDWDGIRTDLPAMGIGIQSGQVLAGAFGSPLRSDFTVFGHVVNLAARLTAIAPARQIVLGEETRRLTDGIASTEPLGEASLKNVSVPIAAFRLLGVDPQGSAFCLECGARTEGAPLCPRCGTPRFSSARLGGDGLLTVAAVQSTRTGVQRSPGLHLIVVSGPYQGADFSISLPCSIGRDALTNQIALSLDPAVSRRHAVLRLEEREVVVADLGSHNGTFLNDRPAGVTPIHNGDIVQIGRTRLVMSGLKNGGDAA